MTNEINLSDLKRAITEAEEMLAKYKEEDIRHLKQKRIKRALKKGYALLNQKSYTQERVDRVTRIIIRSMEDRALIFWLYFFGILLAGALIFTSFEAYSYIKQSWDMNHDIKPGDAVSNVVNVLYKETNLVDILNQVPVPDEVGLRNKKQEFSISNSMDKMPNNLDYVVHYQVTILELNDDYERVIDKKYIRFQLTYFDDEAKERITEPIKTLADLPQNIDGSLIMFTGTQAKNHKTNFEVIFWIGEDAPNSQQGRSYSLAFKVVALVASH